MAEVSRARHVGRAAAAENLFTCLVGLTLTKRGVWHCWPELQLRRQRPAFTIVPMLAASIHGLVIGLLVAATVAALASVLVTVGRFNVALRRMVERERRTRSTNDAQPQAPQRPALGDLSDGDKLLSRDYYDGESIHDLAVDLGLDIDPVSFEEGVMTSETEKIHGSLGARADLPGVGRLEATAGGEAEATSINARSVRHTSRPSFRELMYEIGCALFERDFLRLDLLYFPVGTEHQARLANTLLLSIGAWNLAPPADDANDAQDEASEEAGAPEPGDPDAEARNAAQLLLNRAVDEVREAKRQELKELNLEATTFALIPSTWLVFETPQRGLELWSARVMMDPSAPSGFPRWLGPSYLIRVPLDPEHVSKSGAERFKVGAEVQETVFAKIGSYQEELNSLTLVPYAIFSG